MSSAVYQRNVKTIREVIRERINECAATVGQRLRASVHPIYGSSNGGVPFPIGTCFFIRCKNEPFLVTAAHVIDENSSTTLYVGGAPKLVKIEGVFRVTNKRGGQRSEDRYDFAFLKVPETMQAKLEQVSYIESSEMSMGPVDSTKRVYMAMGYPASQNKLNVQSRIVKARVWRYSSMVKKDDQLSKKLRVTGEDHLYLTHNQKRSRTFDGQTTTSIKPQGASGGVLVDLGTLSNPSNLSSSVPCTGLISGMLIEKHKDHNAIVAVKIGVVLKVIEECSDKD